MCEIGGPIRDPRILSCEEPPEASLWLPPTGIPLAGPSCLQLAPEGYLWLLPQAPATGLLAMGDPVSFECCNTAESKNGLRVASHDMVP